MNLRLWTRASVTLAAAAVLIVGCAKEDKGGQARNTTEKDKGGQVAEKKDTKHDDWWCAEHGIPESECSACSKQLEKEAKARGDWCKEHVPGKGIAKSQCFVCNPKQREEYAKKYRAKYGKEPPEPEDNMPKKDDKKVEKENKHR